MPHQKDSIFFITVALLFFGCIDSANLTGQITQPITTQPEYLVSTPQDQEIQNEGIQAPLLTKDDEILQADSLLFEVRQDKVFETSESGSREIFEATPACFESTCYTSFVYPELIGKNKLLRVHYSDSNALSKENSLSIDGEITLAYVKGPIRKENCFLLSEAQYQKYLKKKSIGFYCSRVLEMESISGLKFSDEFAIIVRPLESNTAGLYVGGNVFLIDEFWINASVLWLTLNHEQVHSALQGYNLPLWFEEGVADYLAYTVNDEIGIYKSSIAGDITKWDPTSNLLTPEENSNRYIYSSWLVKVLQRDNESETLSEVLSNYKKFNVTNYSSLDTKNKKLEEALQEALQDPSFTLEKYAQPY